MADLTPPRSSQSTLLNSSPNKLGQSESHLTVPDGQPSKQEQNRIAREQFEELYSKLERLDLSKEPGAMYEYGRIMVCKMTWFKHAAAVQQARCWLARGYSAGFPEGISAHLMPLRPKLRCVA